MSLLIDDAQNDYIKERRTAESILKVREVCHSLRDRNMEDYILKLDFEKVFGTVDWNFIKNTTKDWVLGLN